MKIKFPCVQCCTLGVCFTEFTSVESLISCVSSVLTVGAGLDKSKKMTSSVELMYHEKFGNLFVPRSYRFFFDMDISEVMEYLRIELSHTSII